MHRHEKKRDMRKLNIFFYTKLSGPVLRLKLLLLFFYLFFYRYLYDLTIEIETIECIHLRIRAFVHNITI